MLPVDRQAQLQAERSHLSHHRIIHLLYLPKLKLLLLLTLRPIMLFYRLGQSQYLDQVVRHLVRNFSSCLLRFNKCHPHNHRSYSRKVQLIHHLGSKLLRSRRCRKSTLECGMDFHRNKHRSCIRTNGNDSYGIHTLSELLVQRVITTYVVSLICFEQTSTVYSYLISILVPFIQSDWNPSSSS